MTLKVLTLFLRRVLPLVLVVLGVPAAAQSADVLRRIGERGQINIGYSEGAPPFSASTPEGPAGFSLDLCAVIAERIKLELGRRDLRIRLIPVASDQFNRSVQAGTVDLLCASVTDTPERRQIMNFSAPIHVSTIKLLTHHPHPFTTLSDLKGQTVVVLGRTPADGIMQAYSHDNALDLQVTRALNADEALARLRLGQAAAWARAEVLLRGAVVDLPDAAAFRVLPTPIATQPLAIAFAQDPRLQQLVDGTLGQMVVSGRFAELHDKWFLRPNVLARKGLGMAMNPELREALSRAR